MLALLNDTNVPLNTKMEYCKVFSRTGMVPKNFYNKPEDVFVAICYGDALGIPPLQALQCIAVINGRPCIWGDGMLAVCSTKPDFVDMQETDDEATQTATCVVKMRDRADVVRTFSHQDAVKACLTKKDSPWQTYPKRMRQVRARGFALRDACAHHLMGIISREEAEDYPKDFSGSTYVVNTSALEPIETYNPEEFEAADSVQKQSIMLMLRKLKFTAERKETMLQHYQTDSVSKLSKAQAEEILKYLDIEDKKLTTPATEEVTNVQV